MGCNQSQGPRETQCGKCGKRAEGKCFTRMKCGAGRSMPAPGFGTFLSPGGSQETVTSVEEAIKAGYRHIDCAQVYTNEADVGKGIAAGLAAVPGLTRADLYITGKVWNTHRKAEHVKAACLETIMALGCDYLDMYLVHWPQSYQFLKAEDAKPDTNCVAPVVNGAALAPHYFPLTNGYHPGGGNGKQGNCVDAPNGVAFSETWATFEELVGQGKLKAIGVSNFTVNHIETLMRTAKIRPACNQIEHHPYLQQNELKRYMKDRGITCVGYATLLNPSLKAEKAGSLWKEPVLKAAAAKYNKSVPQVLIRWAMQSDVLPLIKSVKPDRVRENCSVHDFNLDDNEMAGINLLELNWRHNGQPSGGVASAFDASSPHIKMGNTRAMPVPGFGTFLSPGGAAETARSVTDAIKCGYRHIDCAQVYTNEADVGKGIRDGLASVSGLKRSDLYITGKVWNTHRKAAHVKAACLQTISDLGCDYLDMYLIHWPQSYQFMAPGDAKPDTNCVAPVVNGAALAPHYFPLTDGYHPGGGDGKKGNCVDAPNGVAFSETWAAMEELVGQGKLKAIGVSNFTVGHIETLMRTAKIPPACNQIEHHPYLQQPALKKYLKDKNIGCVGYATLLNPALQADKSASLWKEKALTGPASKYKKTVPQILIRFAIQSDVVPLIKSVKTARLRENFLVSDFELEAGEMDAIAKLDANWRHNAVPSGGVESAFGTNPAENTI